MGLDIAMGLVVLSGAIRGYLRGFVLQAIRLAGLAAGPFLADPIRDYLQPQLAPQFPSIGPELLSRLIWWSAAVLSFVTLTGLGGLTYRLSQRRSMGEPEPNYADQGAGFVFGLAKGAIVAIAMVGLIDKYALDSLKKIAWVDEQVKTSQALALSKQYEPAQKLWETAPIQAYVAQIRRNGSLTPKDATSAVVEVLAHSQGAVEKPAEALKPPVEGSSVKEPPQQAQANTPPSLRVQRRPSPEPGSPDFLRRFDEELKREGLGPKSR
ncbi:MAG: CvpA family protein [Isosphaeraceae bacterium]